MKSLDGLYSYETLLLVLGVILFLVTLILFASQVIREKPFGKLLGFFVVPIVMIGYPTIKSFQFGQAVVQLKADMHWVQRQPTNANLIKLRSDLERVSPRPSSDPSTIAAIANAQIDLGNVEAAKVYVNKALSRLPNNEQVLELHKQLELKPPQKSEPPQPQKKTNSGVNGPGPVSTTIL